MPQAAWLYSKTVSVILAPFFISLGPHISSTTHCHDEMLESSQLECSGNGGTRSTSTQTPPKRSDLAAVKKARSLLPEAERVALQFSRTVAKEDAVALKRLKQSKYTTLRMPNPPSTETRKRLGSSTSRQKPLAPVSSGMAAGLQAIPPHTLCGHVERSLFPKATEAALECLRHSKSVADNYSKANPPRSIAPPTKTQNLLKGFAEGSASVTYWNNSSNQVLQCTRHGTLTTRSFNVSDPEVLDEFNILSGEFLNGQQPDQIYIPLLTLSEHDQCSLWHAAVSNRGEVRLFVSPDASCSFISFKLAKLGNYAFTESFPPRLPLESTKHLYSVISSYVTKKIDAKDVKKTLERNGVVYVSLTKQQMTEQPMAERPLITASSTWAAPSTTISPSTSFPSTSFSHHPLPHLQMAQPYSTVAQLPNYQKTQY